jgi:alpha-glucosidase
METSEIIHPEKDQNRMNHSERGIGAVTSFQRIAKNRFLITCDHANVYLSFLSHDLFRIKFYHTDTLVETTTPAVLPLSTEMEEVTWVEDSETITIATSAIKIVIERIPFRYRVYNQLGELVCEQRSITYRKRNSFTCHFNKEEESHFYGLGEKTGFLDKRNERYTMWNTDVYAPHVPEIEALYVSIPFLIQFAYGRDSYGIFLDNPGKTVFDFRTGKDSYFLQTETGGMDYYFIYGPTLKDVIRNYTSLTGRIPLPPHWALGYHQSRYSYMNQEEVLEIGRTFREKGIPCDVIYLDIHYMDEYRVFTWDPIRFPNPKEMMEELEKLGFKVVPIVDPGVKKDPRYPIYKEGIEQDHFCRKLEGELFIGNVWPGPSAFPDFSDERVAKWWGEKHRFYTSLGIKGIWNDMNEPAVFKENNTMDNDVIHRNNGDPKTHEEIHNLYGFLMSKATYTGLKQLLDGERPFVLTRAGYAGIQRYAATWTGDNRSFWEHLALAMPMVLNMGLSGIPFSGPDIGGFAHHATGELLARWMQMGVFFPYCRNHSAIETIRQEPWSFGETVEEICRKYIQLRYRWLPYIYSLFYESSQTGMPIMRPLILEYPDDRKVYNLCDQFLLGDQVLIAPITRPDTEVRSVYLPKGVWYDYWTGERFSGEQYILANAPLDKLPLYIRGGAILPETELRQHTGNHWEDLTVNVYVSGAKKENSFILYEDDGRTFKYENGEYNIIRFTLFEQDGDIELHSLYLHHGYPVKRNSLVYRIRGLHSRPRGIEGIPEIGPEELKTSDTGWCYHDGTKEVLVKVDSVKEEHTIRFML